MSDQKENIDANTEKNVHGLMTNEEKSVKLKIKSSTIHKRNK